MISVTIGKTKTELDAAIITNKVASRIPVFNNFVRYTLLESKMASILLPIKMKKKIQPSHINFWEIWPENCNNNLWTNRKITELIYDEYVHISMLILNSLYLPIDWFLWLWDTGFHVEWNAEIGNSHQPNSSREGTQNFDVLHGFFLFIFELNGIFKHIYLYNVTVWLS